MPVETDDIQVDEKTSVKLFVMRSIAYITKMVNWQILFGVLVSGLLGWIKFTQSNNADKIERIAAQQDTASTKLDSSNIVVKVAAIKDSVATVKDSGWKVMKAMRDKRTDSSLTVINSKLDYLISINKKDTTQ